MNAAQISLMLSRVHPELRPWVWLQLFFICRWVESVQRAVMIQTDLRTGRVTIRFVGEAPKPSNAYTYTAPATPAWELPDSQDHILGPVIPEYRTCEISRTEPEMIFNHTRTASSGWDPWRHSPKQIEHITCKSCDSAGASAARYAGTC